LPPRTPALRLASLVERVAPALVIADDDELLVTKAVPRATTARLMADGRLTAVHRADGVEPRSIAVNGGCLLFTSGSAGEPKVVVADGDDLVARAEGEAALFEITPADRLLGILPLSFDVGLNQWLTALFAGATLHLADAWLRLDLARIVAHSRITAIAAVPSVWAAALDGSNEPLLYDHDALRFVTISGGSLPPHQLSALGRRLGARVRVHKTYGQSETFRSTAFLDACSPSAEPHVASVGRALNGIELVVARDDSHAAASGEPGEIVHGGIGVMREYLGDPEATRTKVRAHSAARSARVVFTGDTGYLDNHGYLFLLGRGDGMIKTAGVRVYPAEIEQVLVASGDVVEAVAFGVPDRVLGERVVAVVVARTTNVDAAALRAFAAERLPRHLVPADIAVWPSLPRTPNGKPALAAIRDAYRGSRETV
jgi:acyl-coenzyme A synthetase/AMP-(fatty) acid ligase